MSEYLKGIVKAKSDLADAERAVLDNTGSLPVLSKANTLLPPLQEVIVKSIYLAGGLFLSDIKKIVCFQADIQKTERALQALKKDGYLITQNTPMGVLYGLTAEGVRQIRYHKDFYMGEQGAVSAMKLDIEGSLTKRKITSALIADHVFMVQVQELFNQYFTTDKLTRNHYLMNQYLKNISYRATLPQPFSQKDAERYAEEQLESVGFERLKATTEYHDYISFVRKNCFAIPNESTFYLLKEMQTEKTSEYHVLEILQGWNCNVLKYGMERIWKSFEGELTGNLLLQREQTLETCNKYIKYLGDERRSLIQTNAYKKKDDALLLEQITQRLSALETCLARLHSQKEMLETDFSFPVVMGYDEDGNSYEERVLTFKRLEQNAIYMELTGERRLTFYIVQTQDDYFDLFSLHKKTAMLYQMCRRIFPLYQLEIQVLCNTDEQCRFIESKVPSLQKKLLASRETAFLGNMLTEVMTIRVVRSKITERYHFYHQLYNELKGETANESATDE